MCLELWLVPILISLQFSTLNTGFLKSTRKPHSPCLKSESRIIIRISIKRESNVYFIFLQQWIFCESFHSVEIEIRNYRREWLLLLKIHLVLMSTFAILERDEETQRLDKWQKINWVSSLIKIEGGKGDCDLHADYFISSMGSFQNFNRNLWKFLTVFSFNSSKFIPSWRPTSNQSH
jgi:hypothetical protein